MKLIPLDSSEEWVGFDLHGVIREHIVAVDVLIARVHRVQEIRGDRPADQDVIDVVSRGR